MYKRIMCRLPRSICAGSIAGFVAALALFPARSRAAIVYWDLDGTTAGAGGGSTPVGTWNSSNVFWNSQALGTGATAAWVAGDIATFSAGTNATGAYTVSITGTQSIGGLVFEDGTVTLSGGTLSLAAASDFFVGSSLAARIDSTISGSAALRKTGGGSLRLGVANTFSGPLTIAEGTLSVTAEAALGTGTSPVTVEGVTTRGQGGGQLAIGGSTTSGITVNRALLVTGGGPGGDGAALLSVGSNTFNNVTTGTVSDTRIFATDGTTTVTMLNAGPGRTTQLSGPGRWVVSGVTLSGQTSTLLEKAGGGGMILTGTNFIENEVRVSGGSLRIASGAGLPVLSPNGGVLELRTDSVASFVDTRLIGRGTSTVFADRAVGSAAGLLNETVVFSDSSFANAATITYGSRNGFGFTLTGLGSVFADIIFPAGGVTMTNTSSGLLTLAGNLNFVTPDSTTRVHTISGNGDTIVTGNILWTGATHRLDKGSATVGNGTLTLLGTASTYVGGTLINSGTLGVRQLTATGSGAISLGTLATGVGALSYLGAASTGAGETNSKVFISPGTGATIGAILANQSGSAPSPLMLAGSFASTGTGNKTLFLGGTSALDNTFSGLIQDNSGTNKTNLAKVGAGTWIYSPEVLGFSTGATPTTGAVPTSGAVTTNPAQANSGQDMITLASTSGVAIGQLIRGTNIPANSTVTAINANTITISNTLASNVTAGTSLTFGTITGGATTTNNALAMGGQNMITLASAAGVAVGEAVFGPNVPANTIVTALNGTTVTLSNALSSDVAIGTSFTFSVRIRVSSTTLLAVGQLVTGTNVPAGSTVTSVDPATSTVTINNNIGTSIGGNDTLTFGSQTNANSFVVSSLSGIVLGQTVSGTNVPATSIVSKIDPATNTVTISNNITTSVGGGASLTFGAVSGFTGNVTIAGGTLKIRPTATSGSGSDVVNNGSSLTFNADPLTSNQVAGGTFEYVGVSNAASSETLGALSATAGAGTVKLTPTGAGSAALTFASVAASAGSGLNFVVPAGAGNSVTLTGATNTNGILNAHVYLNGADFAAGTPVAAATYTTFAGGAALTTANTTPYLLTGDVTAQTTATINAGIKVASGPRALTLAASQTLTLQNGAATVAGGILVTGGSALTISGGTGITSGGAADLVFRTDTSSDTITLSTPILAGSTGGFTKNGAGTLILSVPNAETGAVTINEGTVRLSGTATLGGSNIGLTTRQGATFDLNGINLGTASSTTNAVGPLVGAGTITNSAASGTASLRFGNNGSNTLFSGSIQNGATATISLVKGGGGTTALTGTSSFTGPMALVGGTIQATTLANIGVASSIGAGNGSSDDTNAASLVFGSSTTTGTLQYTGSTNTSNNIYQTTQTPSVSINRLFTLAGAGTIESSGTFGNAVIGTGQANSAALVFNNTAPVRFSGTGVRTLTLGGTSTSDNEFRLQLINNFNGTPPLNGAALSLVKAGVGLWILNPNPATPNTYTGVTNITGGALQAIEGIGVPTGSNLNLNGGVFQTSGTFTRTIGLLAGEVQVSAAAGGFAASSGKLTVTLSGGALITLGGEAFDPTALIFGSSSALGEVEMTNSIDLAGLTFPLQVDDNPNTALDLARLSGVLSNGAVTKTGGGTLYLTGVNTYAGDTAINGGALVISLLGDSTSANSNIGTGAGKVRIDNNATLSYVGTGLTTDRAIIMAGATGGATIDASGSGPLVLTNVVTSLADGAGAGAKTLTLRGFSADANEVRSEIKNNGVGVNDPISLTKSDAGIWILSGANTYSGATTINGGSLGIGHNSAFGPSGTVTLSNASLFSAGADRTFSNPFTMAGNTTNAVYGEFSLTLGGNVLFASSAGTNTLSNFLATGRTLTINGTVTNADTANNRTLTINGTGTTNLAGVVQDQATNSRTTSITYSGTGLLLLTGPNTYTGTTTPVSGAIQAQDGTGLPANSVLRLSNGVFQTRNPFSRTLSTETTGTNLVGWASGGGFAAAGGNLTLDLQPTGTLVWGVTPGFISGTNSLVFGSTTADSEVNWVDDINLNPTTAGVTRTFVVNDNPATGADVLRISGSLVQSRFPVPPPEDIALTGNTAITKNGAGTLIIEAATANASNSFGGTLTVNAGTLILLGTPTNTTGALTMAPSATGTNLILASGVNFVRPGDFNVSAGTAAGGVAISGGGQLVLHNAATIVNRNFIINDNPLVLDDAIISVPVVNGSTSGSVVHLTKQAAGRLVMSGNNTYSGATVHFKGTTVIDYSASTAEKLSNFGDLEMRGGTLILKGSNTGAVAETVGNLSPGSSTLGLQGFNPGPVGSNPNSYGTLTGTTAPLGGLSMIQLQPMGSQPLSLTFTGFIRNPGGGVVLLSTTGANGTFRSAVTGNLNDGRLLAVDTLLNGRWIAQDGTGKIVRHFGVVQSDPSLWDSSRTYELNGPVTGIGVLGTNRVNGLIFGGSDTTLTINNRARSLILTTAGILVAPESTASVIEITGGKLLTELPYKTAPGADILIQNFSTGRLKISSNLGHSDAPQGNTELITIAGTGIVELAGKSSSVLTYAGSTLLRGSVRVIGGATLRVSGGDAISDYLPIDLGAIGDFGGNLQLNGAAETIGGILAPVNTNQGVNGGSIDLGTGGALTLNQTLAVTYSGTLAGTGTLIKQGNATLTLTPQTASDLLNYSGDLQIRGGTIALTGSNTANTNGLTGVTGIMLHGGDINVQQNAASSLNMLRNDAVIQLAGGSLATSLSTTGGTNSTTNNSAVLNLTSTAGIPVGSFVSGLNIPAGAFVTGITNSTQLTISTTATLTTNGGTFSFSSIGEGLRMTSTTSGRSESALAASVTTGANVISIDAASTTSQLTLNLTQSATPAITRTNNATLLVRGDNLGGGLGGSLNNSARILLGSGSTGLGLVGDTGSLPSNYPILPWAVGSTSDRGAGDTFVTYGQNGLRPLNIASEYSTNYATAAATDNLSINADQAGLATKTVNSLRMDASTLPVTMSGLGGNVLTVTSGAILASMGANANAATLGGFDRIDPGVTDEFVISVTSSSGNPANAVLTISSALNNSGGPTSVTKTGAGTLKMTNTNNFSGGLTVNQGTVEFSDPLAFSLGDPAGAIRLAGGTLKYSGPSDVNLTTHPITLLGASSFYTPTGTGVAGNALSRGSLIDTEVRNVTIAGPSGPGGLVKVGAGSLIMSTAPTYAGATTILQGNASFQTLVGSSGLFLVPENIGGLSPNAITATVTNALNVNQLIVGGVFTTASTLTGSASLAVGTAGIHPAVTIGNGGGDSFLLIGYHDEGAGNGAANTNKTSGTVNFANAGSVNINVSRIFIAQNKGAGSGLVDGDLTLSNGTNNVTAGFMSIGNSPGPDSTGAGGNVALVNLGNGQNNFNIDSLIIGGQNSNGKVVLPIGGALTLRDRAGSGGADLYIGDNDDITNTTQTFNNTTLDTTSGVVDARLNLLVIGRHAGNTSATAGTGGGQGSLRFKAGAIEAQSVRLALVGTRGIFTTTPNSTVAEITQDGGTFRFGNMSKGDGNVTYNWNEGTIENFPGVDSVNQNVFITNRTGFNAQPHFVSVPAGRLMTFETAAGFDGDDDVTKIGSGTLILKGNSSHGGGTFVQQGMVLANNGAGSATGVGIVQVFNGAEIGGQGTISGETTIHSGGKLSVGGVPGGIGSLEIGSDLLLEAGSVLQIEIQSSDLTKDVLNLDGAFYIDLGDPDGMAGTTAELKITDLNPTPLDLGERLTIVNAAGGWDGVGLFKINNALIDDYDVNTNEASAIFYIGGYGFQLDYNGGFGETEVQLVAVPEPGALASLIGGMGMLLGLQRFRRWNAKS